MSNNSFLFDDDDNNDNQDGGFTQSEDVFASDEQEESSEETESEGGETNNRTFLIAAGILGGIILLALVCMAVYAFLILPKQRETAQQGQFMVMTQNVQTAEAATATVAAALNTPTLPPTETPTEAPTAEVGTSTPVVAPTSTEAPPTQDPITATVAAAYTQAAIAQLTIIPTSTALGDVPATGFADEVGLPGLFVMGMVMIVVIFLARRMRSAPMR